MKKFLLASVSVIGLCHAAEPDFIHAGASAAAPMMEIFDGVDPLKDPLKEIKTFYTLTQNLYKAPALEKIHHLRAIHDYLMANINDPYSLEYINELENHFATELWASAVQRVMEDPLHKDAFYIAQDINYGHHFGENSPLRKIPPIVFRQILKHPTHKDYANAAKWLSYAGNDDDRIISTNIWREVATSTDTEKRDEAYIYLFEYGNDAEKDLYRERVREIASTPDHKFSDDAQGVLSSCGNDADKALYLQIKRGIVSSPDLKDSYKACSLIRAGNIGDKEIALKALRKLVSIEDHSHREQTFAARILWDSGEKEGMQIALEAWRKITATENHIDAYFAACDLYENGSEEDKAAIIPKLQHLVSNIIYDSSFCLAVTLLLQHTEDHTILRERIQYVFDNGLFHYYSRKEVVQTLLKSTDPLDRELGVTLKARHFPLPGELSDH